MKQLIIILFLVVIGCRNETKSDEEIDETVYDMWGDFTQVHPEFKKDELPESWYFHDNKEDANRLADLVMKGKKKASSGLYLWYKEANADLPKAGTKSIITNFDGTAQAIIKITKVDTIPFNQISKEYAAMDMGTNIEPLKKWKKAHWDFFANTMKQGGNEPTEKILVVCERFETIWPKKQ
ncbi:ASCH domain-containing protein [Costertonia aggregata]|uniref:ASCH domain-containing protein n=1 Tax=Costertonia aggregata TaxID=343403 RepID=A0A7H9AKX5_9FLAO|nr:ASCH domain-containing protein [Costertonia aggregata]QLG44110.1 ASCH domain-containing protein [Costertonia aggregata]